MKASCFQRYIFGVASLFFCVTIAQDQCDQGEGLMIIRFSTMLDDCMQIWEDSCILFSYNHDDQQWLTMHDLVVGRLTRLSRDIKKLEQDMQQSSIVLISDLEYLVSILRQIEHEYRAQGVKWDNDSIISLTTAIREQINLLL